MRLILLAVLASTASFAQVNPCAEAFSECKEDCALEFSSVRVEVQKKLGKCLKKCSKKLTTCEERELETRTNALDEGALDKAPASSDVDENGMPNRTSGASPRAEEPPRRTPGADPRDDRVTEPAVAPRRPRGEESARPPRDELSDQELPKSARTQLKTDDSAPRPVAEKPARTEAEPIVMTPKPDARKKLDEDVRDDGPRRDEPVARREEPPAKKVDKKKDDLPPAPPRPKEEDHDDLRNY